MCWNDFLECQNIFEMKENKLNALLQVSGLNLDNIFESVVERIGVEFFYVIAMYSYKTNIILNINSC